MVSAYNCDAELYWEIVDLKQYLSRKEDVKAKLQTAISCPDILGVEVQMYPLCTNKSCGKKVLIVPAEKNVNCQNCNRNMLVAAYLVYILLKPN